MTTLVVILGPSGAGKSTLLRRARSLRNATTFEVIDPLKNHIEETYGLPLGSLNDATIKATECPGVGLTYQQILERSFEFWRGVDPNYGARMLGWQLRNALCNGNKEVWVSGIRSVGEAWEVLDAVRDSYGVSLRVHRLEPRDPSKVRPTDRYAQDIEQWLPSRLTTPPELSYDAATWGSYLGELAR